MKVVVREKENGAAQFVRGAVAQALDLAQPVAGNDVFGALSATKGNTSRATPN